jgi:hypothetical protein
MKTGQDVGELALYASDCCLQEVLFNKDETFTRCPRCSGLCEWEIVDVVVAWHEMEEFKNNTHEAA